MNQLKMVHPLHFTVHIVNIFLFGVYDIWQKLVFKHLN